MVRETRHLWVGNLPDNVSKERIKEYFNRYGPVQSVRSLAGRGEGSAVTVAFMDIKSACKARQTENMLDERLLKTDFYDPTSGELGGVSATCPPHPEEKGGGPGGGAAVKLDQQRSSHAYFRGAPTNGPDPGKYDFRGGQQLGQQQQQLGPQQQQQQQRYVGEDYRGGRPRPPYRAAPPFSSDPRSGVGGSPASYRSSYGWKDRGNGPRLLSSGDLYVSDKADGRVGGNKPMNGHASSSSQLDMGPTGGSHSRTAKKKRRKSRSSDSGSDSSGSGSRSSSSSSSRSSSSGSNSSKSRSPSRASVAAKIKSSLGNYLPHTEFDKLCTILVRNLPSRVDDGKLRDELHHEYKRGGCSVRAVRIVTKTNSSGRVAIITFSDPADVSKALEDSRNKRVFGSLIEADKLNNQPDDRPRDYDLNEFHSKATRTLFVGNISREVVPAEIHERFKEFGEILEIDIKKPDYALVQFVDIRSVVRAIRAVDGELIAGQRVRLAFGLSVATKCVWCDGVAAEVTEKMLQQEFAQFGKIQDLIIDRSRGHALVYLDQLKKATMAVREMRGRSLCGSRLQTDYASHECRAAFFDHCKKSGMDIRERAKPWEQEQNLPTDRRDLENKSDRLGGRERSIDSRASSVSRRDDQQRSLVSHNNKKSRDEYDEELRRFQSDRTKYDDSDRCFTPPHSSSRRGGAAASQQHAALPPLSRSPSPPLSRRGRSPGAHSRSSVGGYEIRTEGGSGHRNFSDRDSVVSDGSRQGSPSRDSFRGSGGGSSRYKPRAQVISPPPGGCTDSRHGSPADLDDYESRRRRFRNIGGGESGESSSDFRNVRRGSGERSRDRPPVDPRMVIMDHNHDESKKVAPAAYKLAGVDSGLSEDTSSGSTGSVPDVDNAKLSARVSAPPRRISTDSAVSRSSHQGGGGGPDSLPPSPLTSGGVYAGGSGSSSNGILLRVHGSGPPTETETVAASLSGFGAPRTPSSPPAEEADSESSRPGTPLCDENPENLMSRPAAGPVRLASHLRTSSTSEPMSLPLPMFAQDVLSTSPGDRRSSSGCTPAQQISPPSPPHSSNSSSSSKHAKLTLISPTPTAAKYGAADPRSAARDPRLKSPSLKSPVLPLSTSSTPPGSGNKSRHPLSVVPGGCSSSLTLACPSPDSLGLIGNGGSSSAGSISGGSGSNATSKLKDPRLTGSAASGGLLALAPLPLATVSGLPSPASSGPSKAVSRRAEQYAAAEAIAAGLGGSSMGLEERLKLLDEQYEKWSGLARISGGQSARGDGPGRFSLDLRPNQPSPIVQQLLARRSVFDEDSKRLENLSEKYEPGPEERTAAVGDTASGALADSASYLAPAGMPNLTFKHGPVAGGLTSSSSPLLSLNSPAAVASASPVSSGSNSSNTAFNFPTAGLGPLPAISTVMSMTSLGHTVAPASVGSRPPPLSTSVPTPMLPARSPASPSTAISPRSSFSAGGMASGLPSGRLYFPPPPPASGLAPATPSSRPLEPQQQLQQVQPTAPRPLEEMSDMTPKQQAVTRPLPNKVGTPATNATVPIKPLVDKLGKPTAFTKPSATVTPTLKSTGSSTVAATLRPANLSTTVTKTVSTCTVITSALTPSSTSLSSLPAVEKGEASSTTCSPKLDSSSISGGGGLVAVVGETLMVATAAAETDSDPNVTSTTKDPSLEAKKKLDSLTLITRDPIKTMKKEFDSLTAFKEKKELKEELFAPTIIHKSKSKAEDTKKYDVLDKEGKTKLKDLHGSSSSRDRLSSSSFAKSSKESQKHKQKQKQKNDLKDFLIATATIRKEASKKEDKKLLSQSLSREEARRPEITKPDKKRRLSSNSEIEEIVEPKCKSSKLKDSDGEPDSKRPKLGQSSTEVGHAKLAMGRIPKLEKTKILEVKDVEAAAKKEDLKKDRDRDKKLKSSSSSSLSSLSKSKHELEKSSQKRSCSDKRDDKEKQKEKERARDRDGEKEKHKKKKSSRREEEEKVKKDDVSKSRSLSTDDEMLRKEKEHKKHKESKKKEEKERKDSERDRKDSERKDKEHRTKEHKEKNRDKEKEREKEKLRDKDRESKDDREKVKERKRKKEEERKRTEQARKKKKMENESSSEDDDEQDDDNSSGDEPKKFSIFDEPKFDINNPIYFSMYDKVKARRSCVKAREEEEARKQQEALEKFSKLKAQRAKRETKKKSLDGSDDSMSEGGGMKNLFSDADDDEAAEMASAALKKKTASLIMSSSENEDHFERQMARKRQKAKLLASSGSSGEKKRASFKPKKTALMVDSSDASDVDRQQSSKHRSKLSVHIYSSDENNDIQPGRTTKSSVGIYSESDSDNTTAAREGKIDEKTKVKEESGSSSSAMRKAAASGKQQKLGETSDSASEPDVPKSSALAVLAKSKRKTPTKSESSEGGSTSKKSVKVKAEPLSSDSESDVDSNIKSASSSMMMANIKKEIKTEIKDEPGARTKDESRHQKKKSFKKEKTKERASKEKDKSILGQKMAKIFGTSSEDESVVKNTKPPTPNTSSIKAVAPPPSSSNSTATNNVSSKTKFLTKLSVDQVFSASESEEKMLDSPALMSDSDDDVPSRPPTPSIGQSSVPVTKQTITSSVEDSCLSSLGSVVPALLVSGPQAHDTAVGNSSNNGIAAPTAKETVGNNSNTIERMSRNLFDSSDEEEEYMPPGGKTKQEIDRQRRLSAHERQKENENLFDSLLTVNVDLVPGKLSSRKSPGGALKSPGGCLKSPGSKQQQQAANTSKLSEPQKSPGSHRAPPQLSPGGKPTYLLAHFDKGANREAEKRHREQEKSLLQRSTGAAGSSSKSSDRSGSSRQNETASSRLKAAEVDPFKESDCMQDNSKIERLSGNEDIIELKTVSNHNDSDGNDIKIIEEKIIVKSTRLSESSPEEKKEKSVGSYNHRSEVKQEDRLLMESCRLSSSDRSAVVELDTEDPEPAGNSSSDNYSVFARGSLEAASSPGPASDYDEDRLVIRDEDETETSSDMESESRLSQQETSSSSKSSSSKEGTTEQSDTSEVSILSETKSNRQRETSHEEQLEKSIASITSELETSSSASTIITNSVAACQSDSVLAEKHSEEASEQASSVMQPEIELPVKQRTVISQEETESAVNALLGESFDSFDTEEAPVSSTVEVMDEEPSNSVAVDDEAAAAVAGLAEMLVPEEDMLPAQLSPPPQDSWQQDKVEATKEVAASMENDSNSLGNSVTKESGGLSSNVLVAVSQVTPKEEVEKHSTKSPLDEASIKTSEEEDHSITSSVATAPKSDKASEQVIESKIEVEEEEEVLVAAEAEVLVAAEAEVLVAAEAEVLVAAEAEVLGASEATNKEEFQLVEGALRGRGRGRGRPGYRGRGAAASTANAPPAFQKHVAAVPAATPPRGRGRGRTGRLLGSLDDGGEPLTKELAEFTESTTDSSARGGRGRGRILATARGGSGGFRGVRHLPTVQEDKTPHDVFEFQEEEDITKTKDLAPPRAIAAAPVPQPEDASSREDQQDQPLTVDQDPSVRGSISGRGRGRAAKALAVGQLASAGAKPAPSLTIVNTSLVDLPSTAATLSPGSGGDNSQRPDVAAVPTSQAGILKLSTEDKMSPGTSSLVSPCGSAAKSPKPRMRRSTGGKSRESEDESAETDQKIILILEQAKQEAEQTAAAHNQCPVSVGGSAATPVSAAYSVASVVPLAAHPGNLAASHAAAACEQQKMLHFQRQAAHQQQTVTLVPSPSPLSLVDPARSSSASGQAALRTGIPQPTVLPPRHDQQVRPAASTTQAPALAVATIPSVARLPTTTTTTSRQVTPANLSPVMVTSVPHHVLPIQLPTQPLPPESVRKTQPVLLEQNQPTPGKMPTAGGGGMPNTGMMARTTISFSLPTEPIPRSVAMPGGINGGGGNCVANLSRTPLPISTAAHLAAITRAPMPLVVSGGQIVGTAPRHLVPGGAVVVTRANMIPQPQQQQIRAALHTAEGQRVSLKQRDGLKENEVDLKMREQVAVEAMLSGAQLQPIKREYLQPRERETLRPSSTPLAEHGRSKQEEEKQLVYPAHPTQQFTAAQTMELYKLQELQNYRELTLIYQQLVSAGHPEAMAIQLAQTLLRDRYIEEQQRPGSVPPMSHLHHMEELRRQQQAAGRQPMPAHSSDPYRQTESPLYTHLQPAHSQHPYMQQREPVGPPTAAHMEYRREDLVPPAAHSSQLQRLTHSPAVSDFSASRPQSPAAYQPSILYTSSTAAATVNEMPLTNYRLPYLAAYPICWSGTLALKNDMASVRMHYVSGNRDLAKASLPTSGATLKIVQRMRLEDAQIDGVKRKMDTRSEHCMLLALPNGSEQEEIEKQSKILRNNFITYLQLKSAAGIVNVNNEDNQPAYIVHVFPSCDFANENLARIAPNLLHRVADIEHLVVVIATVFNDAGK